MNWRNASPSSKEIVDASDLSIRILEISSRIATLRSRLASNNQSNQTASIQSQSVVATTAEKSSSQNSKQKELDDLKAKLLGKKK